MLCAVPLKKSVTNYGGLVGYLLIYSKEKVTNCKMKAAALLLFPPKKPAKLFCVQITVLEAEWHTAWFAGASINIFFFYCCSHWCCHRHVVTCAGMPAHQMAVVTNPPPPHMHSLPHMMWHNDWLGGGPHACKCYCPWCILNLVCAA